MKIGIYNSTYIGNYGLEKGAEKIRAHGYDCIDYQQLADTEGDLWKLDARGMEEQLRKERAVYEGAGLEISQTHGPWRWPPKDATPEDRAERFEKMSRAVEATAVLGAPYMVIHPIMPFGTGENPDPARFYEMNFEYMSRLAEKGRACGVVVCLENMPMPMLTLARPQEIADFVRKIDSPYFKMCLDTGHSMVCRTQPGAALRQTKDVVRVLHVHDNDGRGDFHRIPYQGVIDWADFSAALREVEFAGSVSSETGIGSKIPEVAREDMEIALAKIIRHIAG